MKYEIWDRKNKINGVEASYFLNEIPFKNYTGDIILIYGDEKNVSAVECKDILASVYKIDKTLGLDEFMKEYFAKTQQ